jgi:hypothetical protein
MDGSSDVLATWGWGLRRYAWLVALCVIGVGILVPGVQARSSSVYEAQAQVGPTKPLLLSNLDPLPRFAESVFNNGAVARQVRQRLRLPKSASVIPGKVQLTTAQDNPVMVVYGKSTSAATAAHIADQAAATFVVELNKYSGSVGTFAVQDSAQRPARPLPKLLGGPLALVVGLLAGLVVGLGLVGLIVAVRRPVVGASAARAATGLPVMGRVRLGRRAALDAGSLPAMRALCRRLLAADQDVVLVAGSRESEVYEVCANLKSLLASARVAGSRRTRADEAEHGKGSSRELAVPEIVAADPRSPELWVDRPGGRLLTLLLVPEGIRSSRLHLLVDQHASGGQAALALVTHSRQGPLFGARPSSKTALASQPG